LHRFIFECQHICMWIVFSRVRGALLYHAQVDYSRTHVDAGYKELTMPANAKGDFALANPNGLHIWYDSLAINLD
jgi:hypothetical protein